VQLPDIKAKCLELAAGAAELKLLKWFLRMAISSELDAACEESVADRRKHATGSDRRWYSNRPQGER
jgi:hypothetical protein